MYIMTAFGDLTTLIRTAIKSFHDDIAGIVNQLCKFSFEKHSNYFNVNRDSEILF